MAECRGHRVRDYLLYVNTFVNNAIDERRIGAVLKQASHEIGQQVFVAADGRINTARSAELVRVDNLGVKIFAHSMQTLKFVVAVRARVVQNTRQRMCIVRRKLRV